MIARLSQLNLSILHNNGVGRYLTQTDDQLSFVSAGWRLFNRLSLVSPQARAMQVQEAKIPRSQVNGQRHDRAAGAAVNA